LNLSIAERDIAARDLIAREAIGGGQVGHRHRLDRIGCGKEKIEALRCVPAAMPRPRGTVAAASGTPENVPDHAMPHTENDEIRIWRPQLLPKRYFTRTP
jgi:hypothetical protein